VRGPFRTERTSRRARGDFRADGPAPAPTTATGRAADAGRGRAARARAGGAPPACRRPALLRARRAAAPAARPRRRPGGPVADRPVERD
jgi:hypothetical protein